MFPARRWRVFTLHATLCAVVLACLPIGSVISLPSAVQQNGSTDSALVTEVPIVTSTSPAVANVTSSSEEVSMEMSTEIVSTPTTQSYDTVTIKCKSPSEVYSNCSNSCPASCEHTQKEPCRTFCWNGCECAPGYVKNHRWQCIPIDECPKCGTNEHFRNCGANCEPSCDTYENVPVYCSNRASCKRGCFCDYGYVRDLNKNGTCVPIAQCPQKCGANEYWDVNGEPCIRTALNPRPRCLFEAAKAACVCNTGFRRNANTKQCEALSPIGKTHTVETPATVDADSATMHNSERFCGTFASVDKHHRTVFIDSVSFAGN
ncbi:hypothetical protein TYRP_000439 [Tyrophagus putrescentiae]|nr:hypothetical protein TYRP_000439 [Tyrophagus putrescentiae]